MRNVDRPCSAYRVRMENPIPVNNIRKEVLKYFNISEKDFNIRSRERESTFARHVMAYCLWHYTPLYQREISEIVLIERSMVSHAIAGVANLCCAYEHLKSKVIEVEKIIDK